MTCFPYNRVLLFRAVKGPLTMEAVSSLSLSLDYQENLLPPGDTILASPPLGFVLTNSVTVALTRYSLHTDRS